MPINCMFFCFFLIPVRVYARVIVFASTLEDGLESQVVINSIQKAVTVAGSLCSTSEQACLHLPRGGYARTI